MSGRYLYSAAKLIGSSMKSKYTAKVYLDHSLLCQRDGEDVDELYSWMLIETQDKFGNHNGEITDNNTGKVVRCYRKSPVE